MLFISLFVGDKEVFQEGLICSSKFTVDFLATAFCYRMCVVTYIYYLVWMALSTGFPSACVYYQNTSKRGFQVVTGLPGFLGHAYDGFQHRKKKKNGLTTCHLETYTASWTEEEMWIWSEEDKNVLGCKWRSAEFDQVLRHAFWFGKKKIKYQH